ncbi:hypothetical protein [Streptomyces chrestomyceticus]|uniref:hypothetical protein n=1 Tax=Streptomyces chrestomyceticus TaxID=68185 RepID=UPI003401F52C
MSPPKTTTKKPKTTTKKPKTTTTHKATTTKKPKTTTSHKPTTTKKPTTTTPKPKPIKKITAGSETHRELKKDQASLVRGITVEVPVTVTRDDNTTDKQTLRCAYRMEPNPHDNPKYNKNQLAFYGAAGKALGKYVTDNGKLPKPKGNNDPAFSFEWYNVKYTVDSWEQGIGHGYKAKLSPDGQEFEI